MQLAPFREMLVRTINDLSSGVLDRSEVATWALQLIEDDCLFLSDKLIVLTLKRLGAVDLPAPDRDYLYGRNDFAAWQAELLE